MSPQIMIQTTPHRPSAPPASSVMITPTNHDTHRSATGGTMVVSSYSTSASKAIAQGKYRSALECYQLALEEYLKGTPTVVELVNAAATCFNLGALSKKLQDYSQAVDYFCQAEDLYKTCAEEVKKAPDTTNEPQSTMASSCQVCLFQLIVETLQARAHLHYKYQNWLDDAVECHEEVVEVLEQQLEQDRDIVYHKIHFSPLSPDDRWQLQITSLQSLGKFYVERGEFEDGLVAYQEALTVLKEHQSSSLSTKRRQEEIAQIVKALSEVYVQTNSSSLQVPQLRRLALIQEDLGKWDQALSCWERVLYFQSQEYGEESIEVADALCQLARVMVAEENYEGALDLYQAANAKHLKIKAPLSREFISNVVDVFCQLQELADGLEWLEDMMIRSQTDEEKSWIYCELGRIHLQEGQLHEASQTLCKSAELCETDDDRVFELLQKLEFLQQRMEGGGVSNQRMEGGGVSNLRMEVGGVGNKLTLDAIVEVDENSALSGLSIEKRPHGQRLENLLIRPSLLEDFNEENKFEDEALVWNDEQDVLALKDLSLDALRLDALVNESLASHAMVADDSNDFDMSRRVHNISDLSSSMTKNPESSVDKDVSENAMIALEDDRFRSLSPIRSKGTTSEQLLLTSLALEASPFEDDETDRANVVTPNPASKLGGRTSQHETASKSTRDGEQSTESSTERSSCAADDEQVPSQSIKSNLVRESSDPVSDSDNMSSFVSGIDYRFESDEDDEEENTVTSGTASHISDPNCLDSVEEDDPPTVKEALVLDSQNDTTLLRSDSASPSGSLPSSQPKTATPVTNGSPGESSRTGLLHQEEKPFNNPKALRMPTLSSPRNTKAREKREYAEVPQSSKAAPRNRFVKALSSPFRRSRNKTQLQSQGLDALDEEQEITATLPKQSFFEDDASESAAGAPIPYIYDRTFDDEASQVSQITFKMEEQTSKRNNQDGQWWWGVSAEGLEGWFPSSYVHQAVEAAEGFLSAKSIHDLVKSRPLDFDSDDESEEAEQTSVANLKESFNSSLPEPPESPKKPPSLPSLAPKSSVESSAARPSTGSGSVTAVAPSNSVSSKKRTAADRIQEKQALLEKQKLENGPEHISVASTLFDLALLHSENGDVSEALENGRGAIKIQKSTLNLADACKSLHFMADMHSREKQYQTALSCYSEAQRLQEAVFGYFHEETANTLNRIGNVLARQGEFDLAMENHKEALRILKECFGEEVKNPLVSQTLIQIGAVYYKERNSLATIQANVDGYSTFIEAGMLEVIGRAHEERGSYRMAIAFFEEKLQFLNAGENSDDLERVAETLNSLGMLSCRAGLYLEAIDYYDRALGIQMKLGCDDVQLAMARVLAGSVQYSLGHFKKALKLFEDAIRTLRDQVGHEQETVAATLYHMGVVRVALCDFDDAMSDLRDALKIQKKLLGNEHPATLRTRREIGNLYAVYESEVELAFQEYNEVLEAQKRIHGERHPNVAETLHSIGCAQARKGDNAAALKTLEDCYNMRLEFLGMDHPLQATTLHEIAKIQLKRGRVKKAIHICDSALNIRVESLSEHHIDVAVATATKASCMVARGSFADANKTFMEALSIAEEAVGPAHPVVASIHVQMGIMHLRKCHFEEASEAIKGALDIYRKSNLDEDHPGIKEALKDLERVERAEMLCV